MSQLRRLAVQWAEEEQTAMEKVPRAGGQDLIRAEGLWLLWSALARDDEVPRRFNERSCRLWVARVPNCAKLHTGASLARPAQEL